MIADVRVGVPYHRSVVYDYVPSSVICNHPVSGRSIYRCWSRHMVLTIAPPDGTMFKEVNRLYGLASF